MIALFPIRSFRLSRSPVRAHDVLGLAQTALFLPALPPGPLKPRFLRANHCTVVLDTTLVVHHTTYVIKGFRDKETRKLFEGQNSKAVPHDLRRGALKKLSQLHFAEDINDLRVPPGNRLEKLGGDREGQHSIRVNEQYRVCFVWEEGAHDVEIVDYH